MCPNKLSRSDRVPGIFILSLATKQDWRFAPNILKGKKLFQDINTKSLNRERKRLHFCFYRSIPETFRSYWFCGLQGIASDPSTFWVREKDKERMFLRAGIIYVYRKPLNLVVEGDNVCVCAPWDVTLSTKSNTYIFNGDRGQSGVSFIETESNYCRLCM